MSKGTIYLVAHRGRIEAVPHPPYGIMYVGQALREAGYTVRLFHFRGNQDDRLLEAIRDRRPLFVGFSNFLTATLVHDVRLSAKVRALGIPVVWGGIYSTVCPEQALAGADVDYIVQGDGEFVAPLLAEALAQGEAPKDIPGVGYKLKGELVLNPRQPLNRDLDQYRPAWDLVDIESYACPVPGANGHFLGVFVSRGCPFRCAFCYNHGDPERSQWRIHSVDYFRDQVRYLQKRIPLASVGLMGDHPFAYPEQGRAVAVAAEEMGLTWSAAMRVEIMRGDFAKWARQSKATLLGFGIESGSERMLRLIRKGFNPDQARECFAALAQSRIVVLACWVFFFPDETEEDRQQSYRLMDDLHRINPHTSYQVGWFRPYPKTPIWPRCLELGWKPPTTTEAWAERVGEINYAPFSDWSQARRRRLAWDLPWIYRSSPSALAPAVKWLLRRRVQRGAFRLPLEDVAVVVRRKLRGAG